MNSIIIKYQGFPWFRLVILPSDKPRVVIGNGEETEIEVIRGTLVRCYLLEQPELKTPVDGHTENLVLLSYPGEGVAPVVSIALGRELIIPAGGVLRIPLGRKPLELRFSS